MGLVRVHTYSYQLCFVSVRRAGVLIVPSDYTRMKPDNIATQVITGMIWEV